jgi:hypothetical protein
MVFRLPEGGPVRVRTSTQSGSTPTASELEEGEIALNAADGVLYYQTAAGSIGTAGPPDAPSDGGTYARKDGNWIDIEEAANLQVRRGTAAEVAGIIPLTGEPVWVTDTKRLVYGDGATLGGIVVDSVALDATPKAASNGQNTPFGSIFASERVELRGAVGQQTFVAGNARGEGAVDLQMRRTSASQVASGSYSFIGGGQLNTASGLGSAAFGVSAVASGTGAVSFGATADQPYTVAYGVPSSSLYSATVRAQEVTAILGRLTTNATPASLLNPSGQAAFPVPSGVAMAGTVEVFGVKISDGAVAAHYIRKFMIRNVSGTTQLIGNATSVGTDEETDAGLNVSVTEDDSTDTLKIEVTGLASTNIRWIGVVRAMQVGI